MQAKAPWEGCVGISGADGKAEAMVRTTGDAAVRLVQPGRGFFSGRFTRENLGTFDTYLDELCVETYCYEDNFARFDRARTLAEDRGLSVPQVALAYVLGQPLDVFVLVSCNTPEEFADNVRAAGVSLTPEVKLWLERGTGEGAASPA